MKLHYSQTMCVAEVQLIAFEYLMKLHYSQTFRDIYEGMKMV